MRFVYFGSGYFSRCVLELLYAKKNFPALVVSQPDKTQGRGMRLAPMEAAAFAQKTNLPLVTPHSLKNKETVDVIASIKPEVIVVADYGKLLPLEILRIPSIMPLAIHPSLLPRWRGAAPIARAILNGDISTGITIFKMNEKLDAGEIITARKISIAPEENVQTLTARMGQKGAQTLIETMETIARKQYTLTPQQESSATYAAKFSKEEGRICWNSKGVRISAHIRATAGWPGAYTFLNTLLIKVTEVEILPETLDRAPGTVIAVTKDGIDVATDCGAIRIKKLKPQGKKEMDAYAFTLGHSVRPGDALL